MSRVGSSVSPRAGGSLLALPSLPSGCTSTHTKAVVRPLSVLPSWSVGMLAHRDAAPGSAL